jgi:hypothetical protein
VIIRIFNLSDKTTFLPFWIMILPFLYAFVTGYSPVQGDDNFEEFRVFLITLDPQPYIHRNPTLILVFILIGIIDNVLFLILHFVPVYSEGNIVNHIPAKHKLAWCCLQCCVIGASNSIVTMQFIGGIYIMDYIFNT